jgi:predicted DNA-binding transcriptional regulator AlpA
MSRDVLFEKAWAAAELFAVIKNALEAVNLHPEHAHPLTSSEVLLRAAYAKYEDLFGHTEKFGAPRNEPSRELRYEGGKMPGFYKLKEIIGDRRKGIPCILAVSKATWYQGIQKGLYPKPVKLSSRSSAWRASDIEALMKKITSGGIGFDRMPDQEGGKE